MKYYHHLKKILIQSTASMGFKNILLTKGSGDMRIYTLYDSISMTIWEGKNVRRDNSLMFSRC